MNEVILTNAEFAKIDRTQEIKTAYKKLQENTKEKNLFMLANLRSVAELKGFEWVLEKYTPSELCNDMLASMILAWRYGKKECFAAFGKLGETE